MVRSGTPFKNYMQKTEDFPRSIYEYMLQENEQINPKMLNRFAPDLRK